MSTSSASAESDQAPPSTTGYKGKGVDPGNWGNITFDEAEVDVEAQRKALELIENRHRQRPFVEDLSNEPSSPASTHSSSIGHEDHHIEGIDSEMVLQSFSERDHALQHGVDHDLVPIPRAPQSNFFPNARHTVVSGGTFISNVHTVAPQPQEISAFRRIYRGDIEVERVHTDTLTYICHAV
ncbi:hypothetical protein HMN09_01091100 [Mycena chlorophos]|uniref:Uncharacterized protein n=1 Tax=Mycena chlorophos TaxID=658473 RepID=A0A8H6VY81_MYCCL|nr:hypothetical protein HMN09_01091100 [Mycena chlorophos]